ncbi:hypothetical protein LTR66_008599 [Elasticomyces elasticus]|nr:hypothetical protein LTR66_008599 [Elasticomyces elasticus]
MTENSDGKFSNESFVTKIKWFVVIEPGRGSCTCAPISTYGNQGVAKRGLKKSEHAVIYSGETEPTPGSDEQPQSPQEQPMGQSIKVTQTDAGDYPMRSKSRINFGKMHTVEYNWKVLDYGQVCMEWEPWLLLQWRDARDPRTLALTTPPAVPSYPQAVEARRSAMAQQMQSIGAQLNTATGPSTRDYAAQYSAIPGPSQDFAIYPSTAEFDAEVDADESESESSRVEDVNAERGAVDNRASRAGRNVRRSRRHR